MTGDFLTGDLGFLSNAFFFSADLAYYLAGDYLPFFGLGDLPYLFSTGAAASYYYFSYYLPFLLSYNTTDY